MHDKNSNPEIKFSWAKFATFLSSVDAPTSIVSLSNNCILEKLFPNLIVSPLIPLSLINVFDPAPIILILRFLALDNLIVSINSFLSLGLKNNSAGPPKLNQLYCDNNTFFLRSDLNSLLRS